MNKLESMILDNVNKQKKEGNYMKPKRDYGSELLKEAMKHSGINIESVDVKTQD